MANQKNPILIQGDFFELPSLVPSARRPSFAGSIGAIGSPDQQQPHDSFLASCGCRLVQINKTDFAVRVA